MNITVLVLDGEIGAGKSVAIEAIADALKSTGKQVHLVHEPVKEWQDVGILEAFYADPANRAYEFQTYTFVTRLQAIRRACAELAPGDYVVMERSPMTDRFVFMELQRNLVGPMLMRMYGKWWEEWMRLLPESLQKATWLGVYLKPSITACMSRLKERHRSGEEEVSKVYQEKLREAHENFLQGPLKENSMLQEVLVLEGSLVEEDFRVGPARQRLGEAITSFLEERRLRPSILCCADY